MAWGDEARGLRGTQHGLSTSSGWRCVNQSDVHSQTFPVMSCKPYPFGGNATDGRRRRVAVELEVLPGELALPRVGHRSAVREVLVTPGERRIVEAAARGVLPLGLAR